jgi:ectoine hydroxylase-related dioxygenase (phytanoyl-CoA dioxygenase family)
MQTRSAASKSIKGVDAEREVEPPLYRSRYGGLWVDRRDAHDILEGRQARGEVSDADAEVLGHYIEHGYVVFEKATDESVIDEYLAFFEAAWDDPPERAMLHWQRQYLPMDRKFHDEVTKVGSLHLWFDRAQELIFPPRVLRFLTQIYERPPVAFQTMTMRNGSEETLHIDTGPLTLTEPMSMAASWVALEDVQPHSGEFQFIPGTHRLPELLHYGTDKGHQGDYEEYDRILKSTLRMGEERGLRTQTFMAKKGDVLIWHADLMHGGAPILDRERTRLSLVAHFMPLGVMPTFFDSSGVNAVPYPSGGYCIDAIFRDGPPRRESTNSRSSVEPHSRRPIDLWRQWVPQSVRERVPPSFATWVRQLLGHRFERGRRPEEL